MTYTELLRHSVPRKVLAGRAATEVGDFIGMSALLVAAYNETQTVLGPAAVFVAKAGPAFILTTFGGPWLDRWPRRRMLVAIQLAGAALLFGAAATLSVPVLFAVAALLGAIRAADIAVISSVYATQPDNVLRPLLGLLNTVGQASQVIGYVAGGIVAVAIGPRMGLIIDAASFIIAAVIFASLPGGAQSAVKRQRRRAADGLRLIINDQVLRVLAPVTWVVMLVGAVPEALAAAAVPPVWIGAAMAANPAGGTFGAIMAGRSEGRSAWPASPVLFLGISFLVGAPSLAVQFVPGVIASNAAAGAAATAWLVSAQHAFIERAGADQIAHLTATMIASVIVLEGVGTLLVGAIAAATSTALAYGVVGGVMLVAGGLALSFPHRRSIGVSHADDAAVT